jgi:CubicO group peptidase (beta-lactamase class C family)
MSLKTIYTRLIIIFLIFWNCLFFLDNYNNLNGNGSFVYHESQKIKTSSNGPAYWPTTDWITASPASQEVNSQRLQDMTNLIQTGSLRFGIDSLLIIRNGYLIYEAYPSQIYDEDDTHHLFSVTKSFVSTLIGIAIDKGYIEGTDSFLLDFFPNRTINNLDSRKQAIRLEHLLTMTAGFEWEDNVDYYVMSSSGDRVQYVLDRPMTDSPGSRWNYNSGGSHLLSAILDQVTPNGTLAFAEKFLFEPLGISDYNWNLDLYGIPNGATLLYLKPRDMAKLGFLYLMEGKWEDQQIVSREWINQAIKPSISFSPYMEPYTGYGYQWWGLFWGRAYAARGSYEQNIIIIPDIDMIVITTGNSDFLPISLLRNFILPAASYIIIHPFTRLVILLPALVLVFFVPFYINYRGLKKKLRRN